MWKPTEDEKSELCNLYVQCSLAVDQLPYSEEFENLYVAFDKDISRNEVFRVLGNMRKRKELPKKAH